MFGIRIARVLGQGAFAEAGEPLAMFENQGSTSLALHSYLPCTGWRARYAPDYRLDLYDAATLHWVGALPRLRYPVNDVAFHPALPLAAVATGSYDGGWSFEGDLLLWQLETGHAVSILNETRMIVRCRFGEDGRVLRLVLRPHDDPEVAELGTDILRSAIDVPDWLALTDQSIALGKLPLDRRHVATEDTFELIWDSAEVEARLGRMAAARGLPFEARWGVCDVALLPGGEVLATRDRVALERWAPDGTRTALLLSDGAGVQILPRTDKRAVYCHQRIARHPRGGDIVSLVERVELATLERTVLDGGGRAVMLSASASGLLLARDPDGFRMSSYPGDPAAEWDVVLSPDFAPLVTLNLGDYGHENNHLRIDGAPDLYSVAHDTNDMSFVPAEQPGYICRVSPSGPIVERLFPAAVVGGPAASSGLDGGVYVDDRDGPALILGTHLGTRREGPQSFGITRRRLQDGAIAWSQPVGASVAAMAYVAEAGLVAYATTAPRLGLLDARTGEPAFETTPSLDTAPLVITSLGTDGCSLVAGTLDGRVIVYSLDPPSEPEE